MKKNQNNSELDLGESASGSKKKKKILTSPFHITMTCDPQKQETPKMLYKVNAN